MTTIPSLRAELLRLGKWPVTWVITGVWLTLNVSFGYLFDYLTYRDAVGGGDQRLAEALLSQLSLDAVPTTMVTGLPMFGSALILILAALATGSGYGWNTWRTVFTQGPGRLSALGGTMLALAVVVVVFTLLTLGTDLAASAIVMTAAGKALVWPGLGALAKGLGGALLIGATWAAGGALIGILTQEPGAVGRARAGVGADRGEPAAQRRQPARPAGDGHQRPSRHRGRLAGRRPGGGGRRPAGRRTGRAHRAHRHGVGRAAGALPGRLPGGGCPGDLPPRRLTRRGR